MPSEREVEARVRGIASATVERRGFELVDVEYRREPVGWMLRLFIDKPGGVTLADCQRTSEEIGTLLEVEDAVPHRFTLEVSSPGLDRPLTRDRDFLAALGKRIRLTVKEPVGGRRNFAGRLAWFGEAGTPGRPAGTPATMGIIDDSGAEHSLLLNNIDRARLIYEWPELVKPGRKKRTGSGRKG